MGSRAHLGAVKNGCAEVVYTTLPVLVEMDLGWLDFSINRSFGLESATRG
jgi:hypothetical protein